MSDYCPCGSGKAYNDCCEPIIKKLIAAPTAEALMRARYSAYVKTEIDFLLNSCTSTDGIDRKATEDWSRSAKWHGLSIIRTEKGGPGDKDGIVEFIANYDMNGLKEKHHETAKFVKKDNNWLFDSGELKTETVVRSTPKVGRNDPCPCGSGKKYKHCCGK